MNFKKDSNIQIADLRTGIKISAFNQPTAKSTSITTPAYASINKNVAAALPTQKIMVCLFLLRNLMCFYCAFTEPSVK